MKERGHLVTLWMYKCFLPLRVSHCLVLYRWITISEERVFVALGDGGRFPQSLMVENWNSCKFPFFFLRAYTRIHPKQLEIQRNCNKAARDVECEEMIRTLIIELWLSPGYCLQVSWPAIMAPDRRTYQKQSAPEDVRLIKCTQP